MLGLLEISFVNHYFLHDMICIFTTLSSNVQTDDA